MCLSATLVAFQIPFEVIGHKASLTIKSEIGTILTITKLNLNSQYKYFGKFTSSPRLGVRYSYLHVLFSKSANKLAPKRCETVAITEILQYCLTERVITIRRSAWL